jgi:hypothetical protein
LPCTSSSGYWTFFTCQIISGPTKLAISIEKWMKLAHCLTSISRALRVPG